MFGPSYYTIGAYISDGGIYCPDCWKTPDDSEESNDLERDAAVSVAQLEESFYDEGCWCDGCHKELVSPADHEDDFAEPDIPDSESLYMEGERDEELS